jgi:SAM-dependent methyltransferase
VRSDSGSCSGRWRQFRRAGGDRPWRSEDGRAGLCGPSTLTVPCSAHQTASCASCLRPRHESLRRGHCHCSADHQTCASRASALSPVRRSSCASWAFQGARWQPSPQVIGDGRADVRRRVPGWRQGSRQVSLHECVRYCGRVTDLGDMLPRNEVGHLPPDYSKFTARALFRRAIILPAVEANLGNFRVFQQPGIDIACGSGESTEPLEQAGARPVVGVDIAKGALPAYDSRRLTRFVVADDTRLPFRDRSFGIATSVFGWQNRSSKQVVLRIFAEVARVLRPGGAFLSLVSYWGTPDTDTWQYGMTAVTDRPPGAKPGTAPPEGAHRRVTLWNGRKSVATLDNWLWTEQTYREAIAGAGMTWLPPKFARPTSRALAGNPTFWAPYMQKPQHIIVRALLPADG